jgi:hypothetical protein
VTAFATSSRGLSVSRSLIVLTRPAATDDGRILPVGENWAAGGRDNRGGAGNLRRDAAKRRLTANAADGR